MENRVLYACQNFTSSRFLFRSTKNYGFPIFPISIAQRENAAFRYVRKIATALRRTTYQRLFSGKQWRARGNLTRNVFPTLSSTSERFTRSIASRGDKGLEWIKHFGRMSLKLANASGYDRAERPIFFYPAPFLLNRFVRPVEMASPMESCSFILQPASCSDGGDRRNEENTATRCERACWKRSGFSPHGPDVTRNGTVHAVFEFMPADFFRKQCRARLNIRQNYEICMIWYGGEKK